MYWVRSVYWVTGVGQRYEDRSISVVDPLATRAHRRAHPTSHLAAVMPILFARRFRSTMASDPQCSRRLWLLLPRSSLRVLALTCPPYVYAVILTMREIPIGAATAATVIVVCECWAVDASSRVAEVDDISPVDAGDVALVFPTTLACQLTGCSRTLT